jgi:hypothetical protein
VAGDDPRGAGDLLAAVGVVCGRPGTLGVLPATGGLLGTMADAGGPYLSRVKRVCSAAVFGGAAGLAIGAVTHGHGWLAVVALVVVAGVSGLLSALGDIGSVTGLQLLVTPRWVRGRSGRCGRSGTPRPGSWPGWSGR